MKDSHHPHRDHHPHPDHQHTIEIIVNSRVRQVHERELSYAEILELAFPGASNTDTIIYTISVLAQRERDRGVVQLREWG